MKKLEVTAIENGTVIDHIPSKSLFKVVKILGLEYFDNMITIGTNLDSKKLGTKGIIKMKDKYFRSDEINKIALVAPQATLIIIKNFDVVEKSKIDVPNEIIGLVKCVNPKCITNHEEIITKFDVMPGDELKLKCRYCEKISEQKNMTII
jgi:aspartate carbamoyltransferase regulatory subunit